MSYPDNISDKIDAYLKGKLSPEEAKAFNEDMATDSTLSEAFTKENALHNIVLEHKLLDVKALAAEQEALLKNQASGNSMKKGLLIGLGVLLIGGGASYWLTSEDTVEKNTSSVQVEKVVSSEVETSNTPTQEEHIDTKENTTITAAKESSSASEEDESTATPSVVTPSSHPDSSTTKPSAEKTANSSDQPSLADPCAGITLMTNTTVSETCKGKTEGALDITNSTGGQSPYTYELYSIRGESFDSYQNLAPGEYELITTDANGCIKVEAIHVPAISCPIDDYFNPSQGQRWAIPTADKDGILKVMTKKGTPIHSQNIKGGEQAFWDGQTNSGLLSPGYYIFIINYEDGKVLKGSLTITE